MQVNLSTKHEVVVPQVSNSEYQAEFPVPEGDDSTLTKDDCLGPELWAR